MVSDREERDDEIEADKAYCSQKHRDALKFRAIKNGIQDKATKNNPLLPRQLLRNRLIKKARYVVERTFGSQALVQCQSTALLRSSQSTHLAHITRYGELLKRLPKLFVESQMIPQT